MLFRSLSNDSGTILERFYYDVYGEVEFRYSNDTEKGYSEYEVNRLFTGQMLDKETGLYYYKNRYYDPGMGRFVSQDSQGYVDGYNLYEYVTSNPVNAVDPLGLEKNLVAVALGLQKSSISAIQKGRSELDNAESIYMLKRLEIGLGMSSNGSDEGSWSFYYNKSLDLNDIFGFPSPAEMNNFRRGLKKVGLFKAISDAKKTRSLSDTGGWVLNVFDKIKLGGKKGNIILTMLGWLKTGFDYSQCYELLDKYDEYNNYLEKKNYVERWFSIKHSCFSYDEINMKVGISNYYTTKYYYFPKNDYYHLLRFELADLKRNIDKQKEVIPRLISFRKDLSQFSTGAFLADFWGNYIEGVYNVPPGTFHGSIDINERRLKRLNRRISDNINNIDSYRSILHEQSNKAYNLEVKK